MIQRGLMGPADLFMLLSKRVLWIQWPGHHVSLLSRLLHLASAAPGLVLLLYVALISINHIKLGSCPVFERHLSKNINSWQQRSRPSRTARARSDPALSLFWCVRLDRSSEMAKRVVLICSTEMSPLTHFQCYSLALCFCEFPIISIPTVSKFK